MGRLFRVARVARVARGRWTVQGYNAAISACENGSCWEEALQLFESMVL